MSIINIYDGYKYLKYIHTSLQLSKCWRKYGVNALSKYNQHECNFNITSICSSQSFS